MSGTERDPSTSTSTDSNIVGIFEHFIVEYKIKVWIIFFFTLALSYLCLSVLQVIHGQPVKNHGSKFRRALTLTRPNTQTLLFGGLENVLSSIQSPPVLEH
jgi:hypothetical protein